MAKTPKAKSSNPSEPTAEPIPDTAIAANPGEEPADLESVEGAGDPAPAPKPVRRVRKDKVQVEAEGAAAASDEPLVNSIPDPVAAPAPEPAAAQVSDVEAHEAGADDAEADDTGLAETGDSANSDVAITPSEASAPEATEAPDSEALKTTDMPIEVPSEIVTIETAIVEPDETIVAAAIVPAQIKDPYTMTTAANEFTEKFQSMFKDASEKAKAAFEKSQTAFGDAGEFAKGNVEAFVESGKILATGLQELGKTYTAESKTALEAFTSEIKDLAAAKSPSEFLEKHTALMRKQIDSAVAASSKHSEAVLKLANEAFQPISNRVSLAVEKLKPTA